MVTDPEPELCDEARLVLLNRRREAREAGLSRIEARLYAESDLDSGELRKLVKAGFSGPQIAQLLF